jgi:polysaccharide export outer membrane protein
MNYKLMAKWISSFGIVFILLAVSPLLHQNPGAQAAQAEAPPVTDAGQDMLQNLTPAQQNAVIQEVGKAGGQLTPAAAEALKARPEFQGLSPAEVAKGKELLQQQEAAKKATAKPAGPETTREPAKAASGVTNKALGDIPKGETLFERAQAMGKYQDISLDLKPFGYDFFRDAAIKLVTDSKNMPIPLKYVVGPGDEVRIALWGRVNANYNITIDRDGKISIPTIGPLAVAGMTFEQMSQYLIQQAQQMTGTNVDISMGSLRTIPIFILGDVRRPGAYTIGSFATITDSLLLAGGPTEIGSMRNIQLKRNDKVIQTFDLYDLLLKGDKSHDVILQAGDIVFVPVIGPYVGVAGNVKRPALYELKNNFSLEYLFDLAGGIIPTAYTQQIQVERTIRSEKKVVIDIDDKTLARTQSITLQDADLVKVFSIVDKDVNVVYLNGNVKKGGKYALLAGMRLKDILKNEQDLLPDTYFDYALIKRIQLHGKEVSLVPFSLADLLLKNDPASNLELQPRDNIYIFNKALFRDKPVFSVSGEVRNPGRFDLADNSRVKDAIQTAGDLTKDAYLKKGELVRVNKEKEYRTIYFNVSRALAGDSAENIPIQDEDQIVIHSIYEEQWKESVKVTGEIKNPGDFILTDEMRVSDLIYKAGGQTRDTMLDRAEIYRTDWKTKDVTLKTINLGKALQGDPAENAILEDLDRLVVHSVWETVYKKTVSINGDILNPGSYPMADNMTVRDLVFAAGNILESASMDEAEISSQVIDQKRMADIVHKKINLTKALAGDPEHNIALHSYDRVFVKRIPDWGLEKFITLTGEIMFPGRYRIKKEEKLSSLLERAGGYKDSAYLRGAYFTRERVRELQQKSLIEMADRMEQEVLSDSSGQISAALSAEDLAGKKAELDQKQKFVESLRKLKATGRMSIYLTSPSQLKGKEYDIALEDGDTLSIPQKNGVVNVAGAVMTQGSYIYSDNLSYQDYVNQTGGYSRFADKGNVFVMKVDGSARKLSRGFLGLGGGEVTQFGERIKTIEPGDVIIVPEKTTHIAWLRGIRDITQILMNVAVSAGVVFRVY